MGNQIKITDALQMTMYDKFKTAAREQGVYIEAIDCNHDAPSFKNSGSYLVISPSKRYLLELQRHSGTINRLLEDQELMGPGGFNPNYRVIDCAPLMKSAGGDNFDAVMEVFRMIQDEASLVNCFREFGFNELPMFIHENAIYEMVRLKNRSVDPNLPEKIRKRYEKDYKKFVGSVYQKYCDLSEERMKPISPSQQVSKDFFIEHQMDTVQGVINRPFREYFEIAVKRHPKFVYYIDEKPSLHLRDLSNLYKGDGVNLWKNDREVTEWNITFPRCYEDVYYGIMLDFNTRLYHGQTKSIGELGKTEDLETLRVNITDMWNWDSLCKANGVKYYVNHGELEHLNFNATQSIKVAINKADVPMAKSIMYRLVDETYRVRVVSREQGEKNLEASHEDDVRRGLKDNRVFMMYDGLSR